MSCPLCNSTISEDDKVAEAPCCDQVMHSQCLINLIAHSVGHYHNALCSCGGILYLFEHHTFYNNDQHMTNTEELIKQPAAAAAFKNYKKTLSERTKAMGQFSAKLRETRNMFFEQVGTSIDMIKNVKRELIEGLKNSDEYKNYCSSVRRTTSSANKFKRQFNLNDRDIASITPRTHRWRFRHDPGWLIRRKFYIKI